MTDADRAFVLARLREAVHGLGAIDSNPRHFRVEHKGRIYQFQVFALPAVPRDRAETPPRRPVSR